MEEKLNKSDVIELSSEDKIEINAGSERNQDKRIDLFEKLWNLFQG
ncbi:hypothetical protein SF1_13430 [Sphingobacterium faecium NBRC 15299]|nr:hypothetical protein [Sphingobacterium faecium]PTX11867.1 hypothetical protein C8N37_103444 [Sphingobacterium faecium]GEM63361.1 hypothetical protein SF1_13430 [Sphingobacterium faecium NBRC 15299]